MLVALIAYVAMPFDLVSDFIPVAGQRDDAIIVAAVLRSVLRAGGPEERRISAFSEAGGPGQCSRRRPGRLGHRSPTSPPGSLEAELEFMPAP